MYHIGKNSLTVSRCFGTNKAQSKIAGQLQKEFFHNEALQLVDMLLSPVVEGAPLAEPPPNPALGSCYLVAGEATGAWLSHDGSLACFSEGGWRFAIPVDGMSVMNRQTGEYFVRHLNAWETGVAKVREVRVNGKTVVRERQPPIPEPSGGATVDGECRAAISQLIATMRTHGLIE